jgi:hypothetical protein
MAGLFKTPRLRDRPAEAAQRDQATPGGYGRAEPPSRVPLPSYRSAATALGAAGGNMPDSRLYTRLSQSPRLAAVAHDAGVQLAQADPSERPAALIPPNRPDLTDDARAYLFIDEIVDDWEKEEFDASGPSKYGIKQSTLDNWNNRSGQTDPMSRDVRQLTRDEARRILKVDFYDGYSVREVTDRALAHQLLDIYVNTGTKGVRTIIQGALDEVMRNHRLYNRHVPPFALTDPPGPKTRSRLNALVEMGYGTELRNALVLHRDRYARGRRNFSSNRGWIPRIWRFWNPPPITPHQR